MTSTKTAPKVSKVRISRTQAKQIIENSGGRWITTTAKTAKGEIKTMNCRFDGNTSLGNFRVVVRGQKGFKGVTLNELIELKANKNVYRIRK